MRTKYETPKMWTDVLEEEDIVTRSGLIEDSEYDDSKDPNPGGNDWDDMWW